MTKNFLHKVKIYYEDTDSGGVVYYANYLKFLERARSEIIYSLGLTNKKLLNNYNTLIIVKSCNIKYKKPAKFEDVQDLVAGQRGRGVFEVGDLEAGVWSAGISVA